MQFGQVPFILGFVLLYVQCLVCGKLTVRKSIRKQDNGKVTDRTQRKVGPAPLKTKNTNGIRKDLVDTLVGLGGKLESPFPLRIEHIQDYPVPVPVGREIAENVLHVHIHDKNPCVNGGYISRDFRGSYFCVCPPHYGGKTCEIQQFCFSGPCKNGGKCVEINDGYKCKCLPGFTGYDCEEELSCVPNPCEHDGKCVETVGGYKCNCRDGFRGRHCKTIDFCYPNPCLHGGTCGNANNAARCQCHPGYHGTHCQEKFLCYVNPCHNGGRCVENPLQPCLCPTGYVGKYCHDHVCNPDPCLHGGSCIVVDHPLGSRNHRWAFHCSCSQYYRGRICQIPHPCIDQPCLNGGTCMDTYYNSNGGLEQHDTHNAATPSMSQEFVCLCPMGFSGPRCEIDICSLCHRDADCINHHCVCKPRFIGDGINCKNVSRPCFPNPCYHGTCSEGPDGSFDCECHPGYCGPQCKEICSPCLLWPCANGGTCIPKGEKRVCICPPPYEEPDCNVTLPDLCNPNPCKHGGKCKFLPEKDDYVCHCPGNFSGKDCSECTCPRAEKLQDVVVVDAVCDDIGECQCPDSGTSKFFLTDSGCVKKEANPCTPNPCKHEGLCVRDIGGFHCTCTPPYYGRLCECTVCTCENPCKNGATCQDIATREFKCICSPGFTGSDCSVRITNPVGHCSLTKCEHGGTCLELPNGYDCICSPQFTGPHCEVDKCANCDVNADCIYGRCRCRKGYIGTGYVCTEIDKDTRCGICPINHHCVRGMCVCIPGFSCQDTDCGMCPIHHHCVQGRCVCLPGVIC
ncbi:neurogenic locus notch homolog protein 1-like [Montipora capricornis]|uniref:neurogenic locus notch homolog protein 1-like n=1 Tax=Montipora capricornis TaxID=246305 RepID=UPI0035F10BFE